MEYENSIYNNSNESFPLTIVKENENMLASVTEQNEDIGEDDDEILPDEDGVEEGGLEEDELEEEIIHEEELDEHPMEEEHEVDENFKEDEIVDPAYIKAT